MDWASIAVSALGGGVAAGLAGLLLTRLAGGRFRGVLIVVAGLLGAGVAQQAVMPSVRIWQLEQQLNKQPAVQAMKLHDRVIYDQMLDAMREVVSTKQNPALLADIARDHIARSLLTRLPRASDEAATAYMAVLAEQLQTLGEHSSEDCYRFMFPQGQPVEQLAQLLPEALKLREQRAQAEIIRVAKVAPRPIPHLDEVQPVLKELYAGLAQQFGTGVMVLAEPTAVTTNRSLVCKVYGATFSRLAALPEEEAGPAFRFLLGQVQAGVGAPRP